VKGILLILLLSVSQLPPVPVTAKRKQPSGRADMLMQKVAKAPPSRVIVLTFRYSPDFPTNNWVLDASSNLHDWFIYPENQYAASTGTNGTTIWITNSYPQIFFRIWNP
jgi:hypothetical protein